MRLRGVAAVACLAVAAGGSWAALIAVPSVRFAAVVALAVTPALLAVSGVSYRVAVSIGVPCVLGVMLVAGLPAGAFAPPAWPHSLARFASAAALFAAPVSGPTPSPWTLAAVMIASGAVWMAGARLVASGVSTRRSCLAFVLLTVPWLVGLGESRPDHAAWQGALALLAGVLWVSSTAIVIPLALVAAVLSVVISQSIGSATRWFVPRGQRVRASAFTTLETEPTYGPLAGRRTGARMLEITAAKPALWRMRALDYFDGSGWTTAPTPVPELPQPLARPEEITVRVIDLRQDLVVAPGRIDRVDAQGSVARASGEAWRVEPSPRAGDIYRVSASPVVASAAQLAADRAPLGRRARAYTELRPATTSLTPAQLLDWVAGSLGLNVRRPARRLREPTPRTRAQTRSKRTPTATPRVPTAPAGAQTATAPPSSRGVDPRVVALARRLTTGAPTEWDKVVRVERFLLGGGGFRYTTHVPAPGPQPLVTFLLRTHAGYCEQFAGAAALLLRIAGVPVRVIAGFATGKQTGPRRYTVRDVDAHNWIEVYFPGVGWVAFNPTPAASPATIGAGVDPVRPRTGSAAGASAPALPALLGALAVSAGLVLLLRCRRRRRSRGPLEQLERVARRTAGRLEPSTTLAQLEDLMARLGPRVAALAAEAERERFAPGPGSPAGSRHPWIRMTRALASDLGPLRALLLRAPVPRRIRLWSGVVSPASEEGNDEQRQQQEDRRQRQQQRQLP